MASATFLLILSVALVFGGQFTSCQFFSDLSAYPEMEYGSYKSDRSLDLDCACGDVKDNDPSHPLPWRVLISHDDRLLFPGPGMETMDKDKFCSGTIINSRVILTSVKCLLTQPLTEIMGNASLGVVFHDKLVHRPNDIRVVILADSDPSVMHEVEDLYYHPKFFYWLGVHSKVDYDLAMLALKVPLKFGPSSRTNPICIPSESVDDKEFEGVKVSFTKLVSSGDMAGGEGLSAIDGSTLVPDIEVPAPEPTSRRRRRQAQPSISTEVESSFIYSRNKCRVNAQTKWISERFLCSDAPKFSKQHYTEVGSPLYSINDGKHSQLGIVSWKNYFPMLKKRKPLLLSTSVSFFLRRIDDFSKKHNAQWCRKDWNGLPKEKWDNDASASNSISQKLEEGDMTVPWKDLTITSDLRSYKGDCVCGKVNSDLRPSQGRIQGGVDAEPYEYGWMVQIVARRGSNAFTCGGSIINSRLILTAGHCVFFKEQKEAKVQTTSAMADNQVLPKEMTVRVLRHGGPSDTDRKSRLLKVEAIIPHPEYENKLHIYDVALLVLQKPLNFANLRGRVSPLCYPVTGEAANFTGRKDATIIGWGRTNVLKEGSAHTLQLLRVQVISNEECLALLKEYRSQKFGNWEIFLRGNVKICAGTFSTPANYNDPGQGDSGGPLFIPIKPEGRTNLQIGTASLITMHDNESFLMSNLKTITFYVDSTKVLNFVDYYSLIADATWCRRGND